MLVKEFCRIGTTFWLLGKNEEIYDHMSMSPQGCVGTLHVRGCVYVAHHNVHVVHNAVHVGFAYECQQHWSSN